MGVYDIQGKNCMFQLKIGDEYLTVVCAKSFTFNPVTDMKETTTVGSGFWKEFRPRKLSYTITFNGLLQVESLVTQEKIKTFYDYQVQFLPLPYRILYFDNSDNVMNVNGTVYVTSNLFDTSPANLVNGTTELQGTGPIEVLDFVPDYINVTVSVTGEADAKTRFILYEADGTIAYDTSTLLALLPTGGWLVQGESVVLVVQKGQYAWGVSTDEVISETNDFDLNITPALHIDFTSVDLNQNSLPTVYDFLTDKTATFTIGPTTPPPSCVAPSFANQDPMPDGQVGVSYSYSRPVSGSIPFSISNVTKPSWMTIAFVNSTTILISGTPDVAGTDVPISFDVTNGCGTANFADTINIAAAPPTSPVINWDYEENSPSGSFRIYKNSVLVIDTSVSDSGTLTVNAGDVIEAQVFGNFLTTLKHLLVENTTDSITMNDTTGTSTQIYSFAAAASKTYSITASTDPIA